MISHYRSQINQKFRSSGWKQKRKNFISYGFSNAILLVCGINQIGFGSMNDNDIFKIIKEIKNIICYVFSIQHIKYSQIINFSVKKILHAPIETFITFMYVMFKVDNNVNDEIGSEGIFIVYMAFTAGFTQWIFRKDHLKRFILSWECDGIALELTNYAKYVIGNNLWKLWELIHRSKPVYFKYVFVIIFLLHIKWKAMRMIKLIVD